MSDRGDRGNDGIRRKIHVISGGLSLSGDGSQSSIWDDFASDNVDEYDLDEDDAWNDSRNDSWEDVQDTQNEADSLAKDIPNEFRTPSHEAADARLEAEREKNDAESVDSPSQRGFDINSIPPEGLRWTWIEVDRDAITHNIQEFRKKIAPRTKIMAMVKADAYGHGAVECSRIALRAGASWLGVATVQEGIELRNAGITAPILILSQPPAESIPAILEFDLVPAVFAVDFAVALGEAAAARGTVAEYHLAVNTGMNRIGVWCSDVAEFMRNVSFHSALHLQGVFTHFATADGHDTYMFQLQLKRFTEAVDSIRAMKIDPGLVHCANSAAAIRYKESCFDMVRIGIAMYGLNPSMVTRGMMELWPAMSVHARIIALNDVPVGEGVGYDLSYRSPGNVTIATLPLGYADGLSRQLSNRMSVIYKGRFFPQVGNICMDQFMIEVDKRSTLLNSAVEPEIGDEVIVIGREGDVYLHLDDMADALGTINYELACRFGMRLPRIYK